MKLSNIGGEVQALFPTPLYFNQLDRAFHDEEKECFNDELKNLENNVGNYVSENIHVLNDNRLRHLNKWFESCIHDYFNIVVCPSEDVTPYITISWLNCTKKGQYHHEHAHYNSIISSVFYIDVDENTDRVKFHNNQYNNITFVKNTEDHNPYNSNSWYLPVQRGRLLLFPSSLRHSVSTVSTDMNRISLSFNVFVKGVVGDANNKTFLDLRKLRD